jgi:shikimate 5-dehydrogenase
VLPRRSTSASPLSTLVGAEMAVERSGLPVTITLCAALPVPRGGAAAGVVVPCASSKVGVKVAPTAKDKAQRLKGDLGFMRNVRCPGSCDGPRV